MVQIMLVWMFCCQCKDSNTLYIARQTVQGNREEKIVSSSCVDIDCDHKKCEHCGEWSQQVEKGDVYLSELMEEWEFTLS